MTGIVIARTPKGTVLWNGDKQSSSRFQGLMDLLEDKDVILYMLEYIEASNQVKILKRAEVTSITLDDVCRGSQATIGVTDSFVEVLNGGEIPIGEGGGEVFKDTSIAAANFEIFPMIGKPCRCTFREEVVTLAEPKVFAFSFGEIVEGIDRIKLTLVGHLSLGLHAARLLELCRNEEGAYLLLEGVGASCLEPVLQHGDE